MDGNDRDGIADRDTLITEHIHLPKVIALQLKPNLDRGAPLDELIALGNFGLVEAAERFNPQYGVKFSTFAWPRVRGAIVDGLRSTGPYRRGEVAAFRAAVANDVLAPTPASVVLQASEPAEVPVPRAEEEIDLRRQLPRLARALEQLPERERAVAHLHYFEGLQLSDVAARLDLSRSYVTRLHQRALQLLQDDVATPVASKILKAA
jgi:RNA polymerase sigma factor for flagellar operon FliA